MVKIGSAVLRNLTPTKSDACQRKPSKEAFEKVRKSDKRPSLSNSPTLQNVMPVLYRKSPLSAAELAKEARVSLSTLVNAGYLKALKDDGWIFIAGWGKNTNGFNIALYQTGNQPDVPRPKFQDSDRDSIGLARIVAALRYKEAQTYFELAKAANLSPNTVRGRRYMDVLLKQKRAHISSWRRNNSGSPCALYEAGPGRNAPKPRPLTRKEIRTRCREKAATKNEQFSILHRELAQLANAVSMDKNAD